MEQDKEAEKKYQPFDGSSTNVHSQSQQHAAQNAYRFGRFVQSPFTGHGSGPAPTPIAAMSLPNGVVMMCSNQRTYEHTGIVTGKWGTKKGLAFITRGSSHDHDEFLIRE